MEESWQWRGYPIRRLLCQSNSYALDSGDLLDHSGQSRRKKIAVLADMKELGADSKSMHGSMITSFNPRIVTDLFLYGQDMEALYDYAKEIYPSGMVQYFVKMTRKTS